MPDLLRLETAHFALTIWCSDIKKRQQVYDKTLAKRSSDRVGSEVRFSPALTLLTEPFISDSPLLAHGIQAVSSITLPKPLFFENVQYQIEWIFTVSEVNNAEVVHRMRAVNDSFRFAQEKSSIPARLTGTINTSNDIGWLRLPLRYQVAGVTHESTLSFEVLPTKMDLQTDLAAMYQSIDKNYPLWRFSLAEKTEQDAAKGLQRGKFPLLWLANFTRLRKQFEGGLKAISLAPHRRLSANTSFKKADRLKGRLSHRLAERVKEDILSGQKDKRYEIEKKHLSVDTPENRFIKMVVKNSKNCLVDFHAKLQAANSVPDKQRLSDTFLKEIASWQKPLIKMNNQSFMLEVGPFNGQAKESLVLQQKTGYSAVYRVWQQLKFYLDVFSKQASISMKSVAEIYEVWCFLTLREILVESLGFIEKSTNKNNIQLNNFMEYQLKDGLAGAFEFYREDGLKAKLAHEPEFTPKGEYIRSHIVSQQPDILLEITFPNGKRFIWLFDAKYRIKTENERFGNREVESDIAKMDCVPDDAINQMHRYRDALIRMNSEVLKKTQKGLQKSRPVFGAFALYPGYFDQTLQENPYAEAIKEVGIGAFALLPNEYLDDENFRGGREWLTKFLIQQIGVSQSDVLPQDRQEHLLLNDSVRIPHYGMQQALYPDLVMTAALAGMNGRNKDYLAAFESGNAQWYHLPKATFDKKYKQHAVNEIRFLALASTSVVNSHTKQINRLWPVNKLCLLPRSAINEIQAGKSSVSEELYYLFELGKPLTLSHSVQGVPHAPMRNTMRLTTLSRLDTALYFIDIERVYKDALV